MEKILERSALVLSAASLSLSLYMFGIYAGVSYSAAVMCDFVYSPIEGFWISHSDPYYILGYPAMIVFWSMLAFLLLKLFEKGWITSLILLSPLLVALAGLVETNSLILAWRDDPNKYFDALRDTAGVSWVAIGTLAGSILLQAAVTIWKYVNARSKKGLD